MRWSRPGDPQPATIEAVLLDRGNEYLAPMARQFCEGKPPTRKADMVAALLRLLEGEDGLRSLFAKLDDREQSALAETVWSDDGAFNKDRFEAKYGRRPLPRADEMNSGSAFVYRNPRQRACSLPDLLMPGDVVPRDLQQRLRAFIPKPKDAEVEIAGSIPDHVDLPIQVWDPKTSKYSKTTEAVPLRQREMERAALRDVLAVLRLVDAGKVSVTDKNRWPTPGSMRQIVGVLSGGDFYSEKIPNSAEETRKPEETDEEDEVGPISAFAWPLLLQAGKLAQIRGSRLELTKAGKAALTEPPHETISLLWNQWVSSDNLDELRRINIIRGQTGKGRRHLTDPSERRDAIASALEECPVGQWISLDDFSRYMQAGGHEFEVSTGPWSLYIGEPQYGSLGYDGHGGWNILQFRYILCLLMEYAATLGLIDVAYIPPGGARHDFGDMWGVDDFDCFSRYDGLYYMRLNPLGAFCLSVDEKYALPAPEVRKVLEVLPTLEVVASEPLTADDQMLLDTFAEKVNDRAWRIDRERVLSAVSEGRNIREVTVFLESASGAPLPQSVAQFFADVQGRSVALTDLGAARVIRCAAAALADLITADLTAGRLCSRVSQDVLVVPMRAEPAFQKALLKLGYVLPKPSAER